MPPITKRTKIGSSLPILGHYQKQLRKSINQTLREHTSPILKLLQYHMGLANRFGEPANNPSGKAIRPSLCLFTCQAVGGNPNEAINVAVALELVHNFSLIHDDIQDEDIERHHRPTLWYEWGRGKALLAGNVMRLLGEDAILRTKSAEIPVKERLACVSILTESYLEMIEGQYLDLSFESRQDVSPNEYLGMVSKKTGALMGASMHLGAILGTNDKSQITALRNVGQELGLAFQCRDDVLGIWGDKSKTGKAVGSDIMRKKKSLPVVYALQIASGPKKERLTDLYNGQEINSRQVNDVLEILNDLKAQTYTQAVADERHEAAIKWIENAKLNPTSEMALKEVSDFVTRREH